jgi:hypothetical protein
MTKHTYLPCPASSIPADVRFDVPRRNQGQHDEVAYGGFGRAEHDRGAPYKRERTASQAIRGEGGTYYRLADEANRG